MKTRRSASTLATNSLASIQTRVTQACCLAGLLFGLALFACGDSKSAPDADEPVPKPLTREQLRGATEGWNLVLISVDTLRADHLNAFGYQTRPTSPNIDALVEQGVRFEAATAPRASTWPSLATVLTGLYPSGHGLLQNEQGFDDEQTTLPKILQAEGYATGAFLSNMCDANHSGWDQRECSKNANDEALLENVEAWLQSRSQGTDSRGDSKGTRAEQPLFLWTHFFGSHGPYYNGGSLGDELDPGYEGVVQPKRGALNRIMTEGKDLDERDLQHLNAIYDASIIGTDERVGRLLETLGKHIDLGRTVFVFLSDHGEELYEHKKYLYHACSVYETTLQVPLAIVAPGVLPEDGAVSQPVELGDVLPTLLELFGIEPKQCMHGEPLLAYLARPEREGLGKLALSEYAAAPISTTRLGQWKLVENRTNHKQRCLPDTDENFYVIDELELYDLAVDPGETTNLADSRVDLVEQLSAARLERMASVCTTGIEFEETLFTQEMRRRLEENGYVVQ